MQLADVAGGAVLDGEAGDALAVAEGAVEAVITEDLNGGLGGEELLEDGFGDVGLPPGAAAGFFDDGGDGAVAVDVGLDDGAGELVEGAAVDVTVADVGDAEAAGEEAADVVAGGDEDGAAAAAGG